MKQNRIKQFVLIVCLISATCLAMAYSGHLKLSKTVKPPSVITNEGAISLTGKMSRNKIHTGSDGIISVELTLTADDILGINNEKETADYQNVNMVIVMDRSGSMSGQKIRDAKKAVLNLLTDLSPSDRLALVAYSDGVTRLSGLLPVTPAYQKRLSSIIHNVSVGGGTNLGQGLREGINLLMSSEKTENPGRLILISDGLANQGITNPIELGNMASIAAEKAFSISTVGVGNDFNEQLMTAIADRGTGTYYYLENLSHFAAVFKNEFQGTRSVAASSVKITIDEENGIRLVNAGGFPIERRHRQAFFYPGNLLSGETRKLFLTLKVPTDQVMTHTLSGIRVQYRQQDTVYTAKLSKPLTLTCVKDPNEAMASINTPVWADKVIKEDFSRLREEVADDIRLGRQKEAEKKIEAYYTDQQEINTHVQSEAVAQNLDKDLKMLRQTVKDTFAGGRAEVAEKQKKNCKKTAVRRI